ILHSVEDVLQQEFGKSIADEGVHVIDPFTGTGTFITRLLQSGLIPPKQLTYKYKNEIHANELVLLAYYIAAINIEAVYHSEIIDDYTPFQGICLTDTFQMYEKEDLVDQVLVDNSARRKRQMELPIQVIVGNPPYSAGQESANDNNANVKYPSLDERIRQTYADRSVATLKNALYDSYIRAIRWASDRISTQGVIGFVTNAGFIDSNTADGLRQCLVEEFSSLYIFHLRGNQRTSGEKSRQEGGKIFGSGSRAPIAISILVKNPEAEQQGKIYFHDIGDYLSRETKLEMISNFKSIKGISELNAWEIITPDEHGDWLNQRDNSFNNFISMGDKKDVNNPSIFSVYSRGAETSKDAWCYNSLKDKVIRNIKESIDFYNDQRLAFHSQEIISNVDDFIKFDSQKISWGRALKNELKRNKSISFNESGIRLATYRPFNKQWMYLDRQMNNMIYQVPKLFPSRDDENLVIYISGMGSSGKLSSVLMINSIPDLNMQHSGGQGFPLYQYEEVKQDKSVGSGDLFDESLDLTISETKYERKDGISDEGLQHFQAAYPSEQIAKEDIFYYTYGLLHSEEYRTRYADNLTKELPRIPCVKKAEDFWAFSKAGRALAHWHLNYETVEPYKATLDTGSTAYNQLTAEDFYVEKMKFAKKGEKGTVVYNKRITIKDIPIEAYDYVVNGKPALEWVMERQGVSTHKESGIVNDANDWANETMNNAAYPLELFLRVITVSLETMKIVRSLPKLDI
ncbi:MAG: DEAD/DEAH box helicase, partial [Acinetobacter sp.]|nr:DEAD/DEAH box helicase [Acinetobacter sp.]